MAENLMLGSSGSHQTNFRVAFTSKQSGPTDCMPICSFSCAPGEHVASSLVPPKRDSVHVLQDHPTMQAKAQAGGIIRRLASKAIALSGAKAEMWMCPTKNLWDKGIERKVYFSNLIS